MTVTLSAEYLAIVASADWEALQELIDSEALESDGGETIAIYRAIAADPALEISDRKRAALLAYLNESGDTLEPGEAEESRHDDCTFDAGRGEYLVLTDSEADDKTAENITDSVWAFNADFLAGETGFDSDVFTALSDKCEGANPAILSLIKGSCGIAEFCSTAAAADGRGHFLSGYDGEENESGEFYIYRVN